MTEDIIFPKNPFEDIKPSDFNKLNKKHVTEDFVEENFASLGWDVSVPFNDTGIDRIIIKTICPKGHTKLNENLRNKPCPVCKSDGIEIIRFVQVKTRQLKNNIFGFTLKSKDIRIDPRHVYLLYSDNTTADKQDFLIVLVKDYLKFFKDNNLNPFASTSFRKGNNKINDLKYNPSNDKWSWQRYDWEMFRNTKGLSKIQSSHIEQNFNDELIETRKLADSLQFVFNKGRSYSEHTESVINNELKKNINLYGDKSKILELRANINKYLKENCDEQTYDSMNRYFGFIKKLESSGDEKDADKLDSKKKQLDISGDESDGD